MFYTSLGVVQPDDGVALLGTIPSCQSCAGDYCFATAARRVSMGALSDGTTLAADTGYCRRTTPNSSLYNGPRPARGGWTVHAPLSHRPPV